MMHLNGIPVFVTVHATEPSTELARPHVYKPGMKWSYHVRVQKKWIKRFGFVRKAAIYQTPDGIYVHPSLMPEFEKALKSHNVQSN